MKHSDLLFAVECSRAAGRVSVTIEELENFLSHDAHGCFVVENRRGPAGFCIAVRYDTCGLLGAIARAGIRGEALVEQELVEHATAYLLNSGYDRIMAETGRLIIPAFRRAGFIKLGRILRFVGSVYARSHEHVRPMRPPDLSSIISLDRECFRANRSFFLKRRLSLTPQFCKTLRSNGKIGGYIMAHRAKGCIAVGPWVVASTVDCPMDLLEGLALETGVETLSVEVSETNRGAVTLLRAMGFVESPEWVWRMRLGSRTKVGLGDSLYAIGSPFMG